MSASTVQVYYGEEGPAQSLVAAAAEDSNAEPSDGWYPLIPIGRFEHQACGAFEVTLEDANEYVANFEAGLPWGKAGVPIDENGFHDKQAEAYGRISKMEVRGDAVWGYIVWGDRGKQAVAAGDYMYVSPRFVPRGRVFDRNSAGPIENVITAVALTNGPFFADQPGLFDIAAAAYTPPEQIEESDADEDAPDTQPSNSGAATPPEVTHQMDQEKIDEIRAKYEAANGEVTDEAWAELTADFETEKDWTTFADGIEEPADEEPAEEEETPEEGEEAEDKLTISRDELERLQEKAALTDDAVQAAERAEQKANEVAASVHEIKQENRRLKVEDEVKASVYDGGRKPAPAAVDVLVDLRMNPSEVTANALIEHLEANGGRLAMYEPGEAEAVTANAGMSADEVWLDEKDITEQAKDATRTIAAEEDISFRAAYSKYLDRK